MKTLTGFITLTAKEVVAALAYQAVNQSPIFPRELSTVLEKYSALLKSEFFSNAKKLGEYEYIEVGIEDVNSMAKAIRQIPEFLNWNLSENERAAGIQVDDLKRSEHCFVSRFSGPALHDDFVDIDAFIRNFASLIIRNSWQYGELAEKMEDVHERLAWQPIETAPKDGTEVFLCSSAEPFPSECLCRDGYAEGFCKGLDDDGDGDIWLVHDKRPDGGFFIVKPTHWMHKVAGPPFNTDLAEPD